MATKPRVGIIGYGLAGRIFHSRLLKGSGFEITGILSTNDERIAQAASEFPEASIVASVEELIALKPDLIVIASANSSHFPQALACITAKIPVVIDKPTGLNADEVKKVLAASATHGVPVTTFFNRIWDSDILTIQKIMKEDILGKIFRFESRFERFRPLGNELSWREQLSHEEGGGKLLDLQPHLLSTALRLFGSATLNYSSVRSIRGLSNDDSFLALSHSSGVDSYLSACEVMGSVGPRIRMTGLKGSLIIQDLDPQESLLREGKIPVDGSWVEDSRCLAYLHFGDEVVAYPAVPGNYGHFYLQVRKALDGQGPWPVSNEEVLAVATIIDQARQRSIR